MKKILTILALAAISQMAFAADDADLQSLAPTAEDYAKAQAAKKDAKPKLDPQDTQITVRHNQNGEVVEYVVVPATTGVPYTVKPQQATQPNLPGHTDTVKTPSLLKLNF
ncbi:MAG TPA: hypothetical protein DCW60_01820 [Sutterella sp.]|nr:hypothetical protein [Sutterella sp.]